MNNKIKDVLVKWFKDNGCIVESNLYYGSAYRIVIEGEYPEDRFRNIEVVVYDNKDICIWGLGSPNALSKNIDPYKVMYLTIDDPEFFDKLGMLFPVHQMSIGDIIGATIVVSLILMTLMMILVVLWLRVLCVI